MIALALGGAGVGIGYMSAGNPSFRSRWRWSSLHLSDRDRAALAARGWREPASCPARAGRHGLHGRGAGDRARLRHPSTGAASRWPGWRAPRQPCNFFSGTRSPKTPTLAKIFWVNLAVIPACIIVGAVLGALDPPAALTVAPAAVALLIATYMAGLFFQLVALVRASAVVVGLAFCAEPVVATGSPRQSCSAERLVPLQFLGGALVVGAVATNVLMENRRSQALATRRALTE